MEENVFWERFYSLCKKNGTTPSAVARELGIAAGSPTAWKRGAKPTLEAIGKLALFFDTPMEYFYGLGGPEKETEKAPAEPAGASDEDIRFALFGDAPISDSDMEAVRTFAQMLAEKARKKKESDG